MGLFAPNEIGVKIRAVFIAFAVFICAVPQVGWGQMSYGISAGYHHLHGPHWEDLVDIANNGINKKWESLPYLRSGYFLSVFAKRDMSGHFSAGLDYSFGHVSSGADNAGTERRIYSEIHALKATVAYHPFGKPGFKDRPTLFLQLGGGMALCVNSIFAFTAENNTSKKALQGRYNGQTYLAEAALGFTHAIDRQLFISPFVGVAQTGPFALDGFAQKFLQSSSTVTDTAGRLLILRLGFMVSMQPNRERKEAGSL